MGKGGVFDSSTIPFLRAKKEDLVDLDRCMEAALSSTYRTMPDIQRLIIKGDGNRLIQTGGSESRGLGVESLPVTYEI